MQWICRSHDTTHNAAPGTAPHDPAHTDPVSRILQDNVCFVCEHDEGAGVGIGVDNVVKNYDELGWTKSLLVNCNSM